MDASAVGKQIRKLERDLGVVLLARSTRRVDLTAAGRTLLPLAKGIVEDVNTLATTAAQTTSGSTAIVR